MKILNSYGSKRRRYMRTLTAVASVVLLQLPLAVIVMGTDPITSAAEIDFSIVMDDGQADGFSVELQRAALNAMGHDVTFHTGAWPDFRALLETGEIQALPLARSHRKSHS